MWMYQRVHIYIYAYTYFLYVYLCAKVYEDWYVYDVCRVVHIFLYMLNILFIVFILYFSWKLIKARWSINASVGWAFIGSVITVWRLFGTKSLSDPVLAYSQLNPNEPKWWKSYNFSHENASTNVVSKMALILSQPPWVNALAESHAYTQQNNTNILTSELVPSICLAIMLSV